jgi:hypothetical protein
VYYNCVKFHKIPISRLGGVVLTRYMTPLFVKVYIELSPLYWIFMKPYTFVVHYLQMCMKEYGCCPKFKRGDNSMYTFTKRGGMYLVSATH